MKVRPACPQHHIIFEFVGRDAQLNLKRLSGNEDEAKARIASNFVASRIKEAGFHRLALIVEQVKRRRRAFPGGYCENGFIFGSAQTEQDLTVDDAREVLDLFPLVRT